MKGVMLDLETMGNGSNAAITAIGAVEFDTETNLIGDKFYSIIDLESSVNSGGVIDPSTVLWWMKQSDAARNEFTKEGVTMYQALLDFRTWMSGRVAEVWGNGATFDNVVLRNAYLRADVEAPWDFRGDRCYRTLKALHPPILIPSVGTAHNAVNDAEYQARILLEIYKENYNNNHRR